MADAAPAALSVDNVSRTPQQGRSKASLERMLGAARELMMERGSENFTLQDVARRGAVSIGSIYLRFESKDNLVRAVLAQALEEIATEEEAMLAALVAGAADLAGFIPAYVEAYAEALRVNAPMLRLAMLRAEQDPMVSTYGKKSAARALSSATAALLRYQEEFGGTDRPVKAASAFQVIFATLARELSLGSTGDSSSNQDWERLKLELGRMCLAYLRDG